jgi:hydroxyquinol 1,2-dioxygenase
MRQVSEDDITAEVLRRLEGTPNLRLKRVLSSLVTHLHAFVREVEVTEAEWFTAIRLLTEIGKISADRRQEFILLSDTLGVSMLVDLINHRKPQGASESTVIGPFYVENPPEMPYGANIAWNDDGIPMFVYGRVLDVQGRPIPGAQMDLWQTSSDGLYDVQHPGLEEAHMRGRFYTDKEGRYLVRTVRPVSYPIPYDGPVGAMLRATNRQHYRPAHIHFRISAPGVELLTTHVFDSTDKLLDADPVFAVKDSLICDFVRHDTPDPRFAVAPPFYSLEYNFVMKPAVPATATATAQQTAVSSD